MDYLKELNDAQRKAVEQLSGPMMVIAGAGSGKTRVLTYRIAHLINNGIDPFQILALTFTNKAAKEMKERITKILGDSEGANIWMGTFHSVFARILRTEAEKIGYPSNFTIYDTSDAKSVIKTILKELLLDDKVYKPGWVLSRISSAKNNLISPEAYQNNPNLISEDQLSGKPKMAEIYKNYAARCYRSSAMDFDDLLYKTNVLFRDHPDALHKYQHRFKCILVDEYQDTNYSQYLIVKKLAAVNENLCVVGDDAQSIYAFRGANIQNILNFKKDYPDYVLHKLEQNYRSTENIVLAANSIIKHNQNQIEKEVWTSNDSGEKIKVLRALNENEEGRMVASQIFELKMNNQAKNSDFAILYRTNAQSRALEEALRKQNIPYKIHGGLSFYQRKEIKDLISYFRLVVNHKDEEALKRIINYPARGIGKTTIERLEVEAYNAGVPFWDVIESIDTVSSNLNAGTKKKISDFVMMIESFTSTLNNKNAYELGQHIASSSGILKDLFADKSPEGVSKHENIQELLNAMKNFSEKKVENDEEANLGLFLQDVALLTDADSENEEDNNRTSLMTIHSAKGLEYPYVFIVGMEENLFPSQLSLSSRTELEEERRLFYVAVTRGMNKIVISHADTRYKWGNVITCEPSRFIEEIDSSYIEKPMIQEKTQSFSKELKTKDFPKKVITRSSPPPLPVDKRNLKKLTPDTEPTSTSTLSTYDSGLRAGMTVAHQKFGRGEIKLIEGEKATIQFQKFGQKQLLLKFAKLQILKHNKQQ